MGKPGSVIRISIIHKNQHALISITSGLTVLFTFTFLAVSIVVPLSTVNISTTSNCHCLIVHAVFVFCRF